MSEAMQAPVACLADVPLEGRDKLSYGEQAERAMIGALHAEATRRAFIETGAARFSVRTDLRSVNYGPNEMKSPPAGIVLHHTAGDEGSDLPTLMGRTVRQVSSNDYITKQGVIYELVPHPRRAWAQGYNTRNDALYWDDGNSAYWSVEIENYGNNRDPYPAAQIDAVVWRCRRLRQKWPNISATEQVFRHRDYAAEKSDTSDNFPYEEVRRRIFARTDPTDGGTIAPAPEAKFRLRRYNFLSVLPEHKAMAKAATEAVNAECVAAGKEKVATYAGSTPEKVGYATAESAKAPFGQTVSIVIGAPALKYVSGSVTVIGAPDETDIWSTYEMYKTKGSAEALEAFLAEIEDREKLSGGAVIKDYRKRLGIEAPVVVLPGKGDLTLDALTAIYDVLPRSEYEKKLSGLNAAMRKYGITGPYRISAFLGNLAEESACLKYVEEIASGSAYEGRIDLGNTRPGDGVRFKGRGYIQITGRFNYTAVSKALGYDFVKDPEAMEKPEWAALVSGWFWNNRNLNYYADQGNAGWPEVCRRVNGRYPANGQATRNRYYSRAWEVLSK